MCFAIFYIRRCCKSKWAAGSFSCFWRQEPQITLEIRSWCSICWYWCRYWVSHPCKRWSMEGVSHLAFSLSTCKCWMMIQLHTNACFSFSNLSIIQVLSNEEAIDIARKTRDPQKAAKQLVAEALNRESKDDISCIVVRFRG